MVTHGCFVSSPNAGKSSKLLVKWNEDGDLNSNVPRSAASLTLFPCLWKSYLQCCIFHTVTSYLEPIPLPICKEQLFSSVGGGSGCRVSWCHKPGGITYKLLGKSCYIDSFLFCFNFSKELLQKQKLIGRSKNCIIPEYFPHPISINSITKIRSNFSSKL